MKKMTPETTQALHICSTAGYEKTCRVKRAITVWKNLVEILQSKDEIKDEYNNTAIIQNRQTPQASQQQDTSPALIENWCLGLFENSSLMNFKRTTCVVVNLKSMACFSFSRNLVCEWHFQARNTGTLMWSKINLSICSLLLLMIGMNLSYSFLDVDFKSQIQINK